MPAHRRIQGPARVNLGVMGYLGRSALDGRQGVPDGAIREMSDSLKANARWSTGQPPWRSAGALDARSLLDIGGDSYP